MKRGLLILIFFILFLNILSVNSLRLDVGEEEKVNVDDNNYHITLEGISDEDEPRARIDVDGDTETFDEGEKREVSGIIIFAEKIKRTGENEGYVRIEIFSKDETILDLKDSDTVEVNNKDYEVKLEGISDEDEPRASISVDGEIEVFSKDETIEVSGLKVKCEAIVKVDDDEGYVILSFDSVLSELVYFDDSEDIELGDEEYRVELVDVDDDPLEAKIKVEDETKTMNEGDTEEMNGVIVHLKKIFYAPDEDDSFVLVDLTLNEEYDDSEDEEDIEDEEDVEDSEDEEDIEDEEENEEENETEVVVEPEPITEPTPTTTTTSQEITKISSSQASQKVADRLRMDSCSSCNVVLREIVDDGKIRKVYEIDAEKSSRLFFIFKKNMKIKSQVDADTGEIIDVDKPWWAFLANE